MLKKENLQKAISILFPIKERMFKKENIQKAINILFPIELNDNINKQLNGWFEDELNKYFIKFNNNKKPNINSYNYDLIKYFINEELFDKNNIEIVKNTKNIIGFCGYAGSGKDTCALAPILKDFKKMSFATPIKEVVSILFNLSYDQLYDTKLKEEVIFSEYTYLDPEKGETTIQHPSLFVKINDKYVPGTPRNILQTLGTEIIRNLDTNFFLNHLILRIKNEISNKIVICDVRFENEADLIIKLLNGKVFKVIRPNLILSDSKFSHSSEKQLDNITDIILNDNTIEELYNKLEKIYNYYYN